MFLSQKHQHLHFNPTAGACMQHINSVVATASKLRGQQILSCETSNGHATLDCKELASTDAEQASRA